MSKISKTNYYIETDNISKRIALLTDIHYYSNKDRKKLDLLYDNLKNEKYDYLCIVGDFIDEAMIKDVDIFINWLKKVSGLSKIFISIGGHDIVKKVKKREYYYNEEVYSKIKEIKNVYLLDNDVYVDCDIRFIGLTLPLDYYYKYKENLNYFMRYVNNNFETYEDKYNILLCHTPIPLTKLENYDNVRLLKNIPLALSWHTHAGIVPKFLRGIMKGRGIFSPHHGKMFPKDSYGLIKKENTQIIISSGVTKASHSNPLPFVDCFFDREITFVNLKKKV